jgi:hypothetical protein
MSRKDKKEWTLETLLSVVGFLFELLRVVVNALRARNGTVDDLRRLIREPKLVDQVFDLIVGAKSAITRFIVADHFTKNSSEVKFYGFFGGFEEWFLLKVEELATVELPKFHHDLKRDSLDTEIIDDLGGKEAAEVTLAGVFGLLKLQPRGESGELLTNGYANIFYVRDIAGELRAVDVYWDVDGWDVDAFRVDGEIGWDAVGRVFSR